MKKKKKIMHASFNKIKQVMYLGWNESLNNVKILLHTKLN